MKTPILAAALVLALVAGAAVTAHADEGPLRPDTMRPEAPPPDSTPHDTAPPEETRPEETRPDARRPEVRGPETPPPDTTDRRAPDHTGDPTRTVVLIFNHGTRRPQYRHLCNRERDIPGVIRAVAQETRWRIHYLCSKATDDGVDGSYTYKRAGEIERVVDAYRARGVPAKRIFLVGHSAGGWSSLIAARRFGRKFNAVIAFAPAFAGPRYETAKYPWWRNKIRPRQIKDILQAGRMRALVFAYPDDAFNRPRELAFLTGLKGVRLITFDQCPERSHGTTYSDCFARAAAPTIMTYIRARLAPKS